MADLSTDPRTRVAFRAAAMQLVARGRVADRLCKALAQGTEGTVLRFDIGTMGGSRYTIALTRTHVVTAGAGFLDVAQQYPAAALRAIERTSDGLRMTFRTFGLRHVYEGVVDTPDLVRAYLEVCGMVPRDSPPNTPARLPGVARSAGEVSGPTRTQTPRPSVQQARAAVPGGRPEVDPSWQPFRVGPELSWQAAERLAAAHLSGIGFAAVRLTAAGADGGIDVAGPGVVAQVKNFSSRIGPRPVRELAGVALGRTAVFYALSGYTPAAVTAANDAAVALFEYASDGSVTAVNAVARALARSGPQRVDIASVAEQDRHISERAAQVAAKGRSLARVRGLSAWRRERVLGRVRNAAALLTRATTEVHLSARQRERLVSAADQEIRSGASIAGVKYRKL